MFVLRHRQGRHLLRRALEECGAVEHLAARVLIPSTKAIAFDSPFPLVNSTIVALLSFHRCRHLPGRERYQVYFRGFRGTFNHDEFQTHWGPEEAVFAYDLSLRMFRRARGKVVPLEETVLARVGLDLDRQCERLVDNWFPVSGPPVLPATMLAYDATMQFEPEATPYVVIHARNAGIDWQFAWHVLFKIMHVDADTTGLGVQLIDTRIHSGLRSPDGKPLWLGEHLDLRGFLGRACYNPARHLTGDCGDESETIARMRRLLDEGVARACTDDDLLRAAGNVGSPLILSRCCRMQVWRPSDGAAQPDAFIFADPGLCADLWHVRPEWQRQFQPPSLPVSPPVEAPSPHPPLEVRQRQAA